MGNFAFSTRAPLTNADAGEDNPDHSIVLSPRGEEGYRRREEVDPIRSDPPELVKH